MYGAVVPLHRSMKRLRSSVREKLGRKASESFSTVQAAEAVPLSMPSGILLSSF